MRHEGTTSGGDRSGPCMQDTLVFLPGTGLGEMHLEGTTAPAFRAGWMVCSATCGSWFTPRHWSYSKAGRRQKYVAQGYTSASRDLSIDFCRNLRECNSLQGTSLQGRRNHTYCQPPATVLNFDPMLPVTPEL
jgi:hypothetical protein